MSLTLTAPQRRVLGVLMEKALATPAYYPMTLNAIVAACNQKSNRDPVVSYGEGEVGKVLHELIQMELVDHAPPEPGARSNRFKHEVEARLGWNRRQRAVLTELLLRGPQTIGELRTRVSRMVQLPDLQAVASVLQELAELAPPVVVELSREPGRSANRFAHTLYAEGEEPTGIDVAPRETGQPAQSPLPADALVARLDRLETAVDQLRAELAMLRQKFGDEHARPPES